MARKKADPILEETEGLFEVNGGGDIENEELAAANEFGESTEPETNGDNAPDWGEGDNPEACNGWLPCSEAVDSGAADITRAESEGETGNAEVESPYSNNSAGGEDGGQETDYSSLLSEVSSMGLNQTEEAPPLTLPEGGDTLPPEYAPIMDEPTTAHEDTGDDAGAESASALPGAENAETPERTRRVSRRQPAAPRRDERILTIDAHDEVQSEADREATLWHDVQNAYRTRRILTGTLDSVERTDNGMTVAVVTYNGFRVAIPLKEMMIYAGQMPTGFELRNLLVQLHRNLNARIGSEIDFMIKGIENKSRSIVASRKDAMYRKRQTFYMDENEFGETMIYEGRVVQARVVSVAEKIMRVEVFGVECAIRAPGMSWMWIGNARDHYNVGDRVLVRVLRISKPSVEDLRIEADIRSVSATTSADNLSKCVVQGRYAGRVTDVRGGVVFIRLNNGVNAVAHSCYDARTPGKKDDVSFAVTRLDVEQGVAHGLITRIIRQNI